MKTDFETTAQYIERLVQNCEEIAVMIDNSTDEIDIAAMQEDYDRWAKEADELLGKPSEPNTAEAIWPPRPA